MIQILKKIIANEIQNLGLPPSIPSNKSGRHLTQHARAGPPAFKPEALPSISPH
jgi:hypothetical protein